MIVLNSIQHTQISSDPSWKVANSQAHGIGRVSAHNDLFLVNNLGRDISIFDSQLKKIAVFDETAYPDLDEESQFDFDAHALLIDPLNNLWCINHYGIVRVFEGFNHSSLAVSPLQLRPFLTSNWAGDVERFAFCWPYLVSSSPAGYSSPTGAHPGILVSQRLDLWLDNNSSKGPEKKVLLDTTAHLEDWGILTGFALSPGQKLLAVASGQHVGCYILDEKDNLRPGDCLFTLSVNFAVTWMTFVGKKLIAAGPDKESELMRPDWEELTGGGWAMIDAASGHVSQSSSLDVPLAWGNGSEPLAVGPDENILLCFDRKGSVYIWELSTGTMVAKHLLEFDGSRGIAHSAIGSGVAVVGYNRDGYQLHRYAIGE